ncbi:MAG: conjugal transfer protein TraF [Candidatus Aenigmarchaeota archaeon]|nr:conjugal transfer protein TraF [Candidatus Aenigmarchaeota archaeon]
MGKKINVKIIIAAFVISTILFSAGLFVGYSVNKERLGDIERRLVDIKSGIENFQLQFLFLDALGDKAACPLLSNTLKRINNESYEIGTKLTFFSSSSEVADYTQYNDLKKEYSRILIGYWLLANKLNNACNLGANTIIYFYRKDCRLCDNQAFILTYLKNKYQEKVLIFALDADLDEPSIETLKKFYEVVEYPTLIANSKVYGGFQETRKIEEIMNMSNYST